MPSPSSIYGPIFAEPTTFWKMHNRKFRLYATGNALAQAGAAVVVTARGQEAFRTVEEKVAAFGGQAAGIQADASNMEVAQRVIDFAVSRFGASTFW